MRTSAPGRVDDTTDRLIKHTVIVCLEPDADSLLLHSLSFSFVSFLRIDDRALGGTSPEGAAGSPMWRFTHGCVSTQHSPQKETARDHA